MQPRQEGITAPKNGDVKSTTRKLRSTNVKPKATDTALFDFDNVNEYLQNNKPIKISNTTTSNQTPYRHYDVNYTQLPKLPTRSPVSKIKRLLPRRSSKEDPLPDATYEIFHRKMRRNEKQMSNEERIKNLWELDTLQSHLEDLNQLHWFRVLPSITAVTDAKDYSELERKRDLTIREIERLLRKHDIWRKRKDIFDNDVKNYINYDTSGGSDVEYDEPIAQLRERRLYERRKKYGPVLKLNLNNKYCLVIDPLAPPKITEVEPTNLLDRILRNGRQNKNTKEKEEHQEKGYTIGEEQGLDFDNYIEEDEVDKIETYAEVLWKPKSLRSKAKVRLEDLDDVSEIDFQTDETRLFGTEFEDIPTYANGFQLPGKIKNWSNKK